MSIQHTLNLYQRPAQGNAFVGRYVAYNYTHRIQAVGWYDTAACELSLSPADAEDFFLNNLGCRVSVIVDNPAEPAWEGFVNRISLNQGAFSYSRSLDDMVNRATVIYTVDNTTTAERSPTVDNTASQAVYGIKEGSIEGYIREQTDNGRILALRNRYLAQKAWPVPTEALTGGSDFTVQVEMLGWYHTLNWVTYNVSSDIATRTATNTLIFALATYPATNQVFVNTTDTSAIVANTGFNMGSARERTGLTFWQYMQMIQEAGDGTNEWITGVTATRYNSTSRRVYYRAASTEVKYTVKRSEGLVRDKLGKRVRPWTVQPDGIVRATDVFQGFNSQYDNDPREFYAQTVTYDANAQTVKIEGDDNLSPDGIFNLKKYYKLRNVKIGAEKRTIR